MMLQKSSGMFSGNKYFYLTYDADEEKIKGNFSQKMMDEAINEYIATNYSKKISPLLNIRDEKGKKSYTIPTATKKVKDQLKSMYL